MHIEPGVVVGAKMAIGYATAAGSLGLAGKLALDAIRDDGGVAALALRSVATTALVFGFFQVLPHHPVGVSEVHLILGTTLFLVFGGGAAAIGLALGLLAQGLLVAPADLPQYAMNLTTLLVPLFAVSQLARRVIPRGTAYADVTYRQALALSASFQGGIVAWVAFWVIYGQGFGAETLSSLAAFGLAYLTVLLVEPLADLGALALAKRMRGVGGRLLVTSRVHQPA